MCPIIDGMDVNAANTNASFVHKNSDDVITGKIALENTDVASGASISNLQAEVNGKIDSDQMGVPSGVATLGVDGKLASAQLPEISITDTYVVASEAAMLALSLAETGDVAVRTDLNKSFILKGSSYSTLADWQELLTPTAGVSSVNGNTGAVTITAESLVAPGASGNVLTSNGTSWVSQAPAAGSGTTKRAFIRDEKSSGTNAGGATSGSYFTRDLNTLSDPDSIGITLSSNQFTLPSGKYFIRFSVPGVFVNQHRAKLRNVTASSDSILGQTASAVRSGAESTTHSMGEGVVTIASSTTFSIMQRTKESHGTSGLGLAATFGDVEVYTTVYIEKIT